jgi:hypothetical protein
MLNTSISPAPTTTALSVRNTATNGIATVTASLKPSDCGDDRDQRRGSLIGWVQGHWPVGSR